MAHALGWPDLNDIRLQRRRVFSCQNAIRNWFDASAGVDRLEWEAMTQRGWAVQSPGPWPDGRPMFKVTTLGTILTRLRLHAEGALAELGGAP
jgi:hypothetical protein